MIENQANKLIDSGQVENNSRPEMDISSGSLVLPLTIHNLPYEILDKIFSYLGIHDVGRCMMVSKRWNSIGSESKIKELIFKNTDKYHTYYDKWRTKELFDQKMVISNIHLSKPLSLNTTFLRRLCLYDNKNHNFQLHHLNKFVHLQHLELNYFDQKSQKGITFLNLPKLNILYCSLVDCKIVFNTPALSTVYMLGSSNVRFRNLPTLKLLQYESGVFDDDFYTFNRIKRVEVFRMQYNKNLHIICNVLCNLKEVNELRWEFYQLANAIDRAYFEEWIPEILELRRMLNKRNVKIYIFDILLEDGKAFDEYGFENVDRLHVY